MALSLAIVAVMGAVAVTLLPLFLLSRAEQRSKACFEELLESAQGAPASCAPRGYELALARRLPWFEGDAAQLQADIDDRIATLDYAMATAIVPNAEARRGAVDRLIDRRLSVLPARAAGEPLLVLEGAFEEVAERASQSDDKRFRAFAFKSAAAVAALDSLRALAQGGDTGDHFSLNLRRGAALCLLGDPDSGAQALVAADVTHRELSDAGDGLGAARLGLSACEHGNASPEIDPRNVDARHLPGLVALEASTGEPDAVDPDAVDRVRTLLDDPNAGVPGEVRLRLAPYSVILEPFDAMAALAVFAPQHAPSAMFDPEPLRSPWRLLDAGPPALFVLTHPERAEALAIALETRIEALPEGPAACAGDECPVSAALEMPRSVMREAVRTLWLDLAVAHARAGRHEEALDAAARATSLTAPRRRHQSAAVHLAVGDAEGALALLAPDRAKLDQHDPPTQVRVLLLEALALAHIGDTAEAYASAEQAYATAVGAQRGADPSADPTFASVILDDDRAAAAWMWSAMALATGKAETVQKLLADAPEAPIAAAAEWLALAIKPEEERRPLRWGRTLRDPVGAALPAVMYAASRAVPDDVDVEVWLDRVFHEEHRSRPLRAMLARAEAARWRGDEAAERRWLERAARLRALVSDYPTTLLAHLAELI